MKTIGKLTAAATLGVAALGLSGCATGLPTRVSRFNAMPAAAGQSFYVVPANPADVGGLQFTRYAAIVAEAMRAQGYAQAPSTNQASMFVRIAYGIDGGTEEVRSYPSSFGYGRFYHYPRFGRWHGWSPYYYGWADPFYGGYDIDTDTIYKSFLDVDIRRKADNAALFEGQVRARSGNDDLTKLMPSLVTAMFTGFPGRDGETVKITVPPEGKGNRASAGY